MRRLAAGLVAAAMLLGCRPFGGYFGEHAFYPEEGHFRVRYGDEGGRLLPPPWRLVNYQYEGPLPRSARRQGYFDRYENREGGRLRWPRMDLLFRRAEPPGEPATTVAGFVWVRSFLVDPIDAPRGFETFLIRSAQQPVSDADRLPLIPREVRRFPLGASHVRDAGPVTVDGRRGWYTRWESPDGANHALVGLVESGHVVQIGHDGFPVWLSFGTSGRWEHRERDEAALVALVRRIDFAD